MAVATRNLIVFQSSIFGNQIINQLLAHNWDVYIANDLEQATQLLYKHKFKVGLYLMDTMCSDNCLIGKSCLIDNCTNEKLLAKLHLLFNSDVPINWIMGLPKER
jgi:hypothetical protein